MLKPGPLTDEEWSFAEKLTRSIFKIQKDDVHVNYSPPKNNISRDLFYPMTNSPWITVSNVQMAFQTPPEPKNPVD